MMRRETWIGRSESPQRDAYRLAVARAGTMWAARASAHAEERQGLTSPPRSRSRGQGRGQGPATVLHQRFERTSHGVDSHVSEHVPVMLDEVVEAAALRPGGCYVDCTFGRGGHTRAVLDRIGPAGRVLAMDRDPQAVAAARELIRCDPRLAVAHVRFGEIGEFVSAAGYAGRVDAVLMDLGVSSPQLDQPERGFSFLNDGPLDMRMDPGAGTSAAEWLANASEREIGRVLREFGEERAARRIARAVVAERKRSAPIATTRRLAAIVARAVRGGGARARVHPATRTFQAIRLHVNDELGELERALAAMPHLLAPGGRLVVLSFHSLEDRIVKRFMRGDATAAVHPRRLPIPDASRPARTMTPLMRARRPCEGEVAANPRARSAVLRVAERSG